MHDFKRGDRVHIEFNGVYQGEDIEYGADWSVVQYVSQGGYTILIRPAILGDIATKIETFNHGDIVRDADGDVFEYSSGPEPFTCIASGWPGRKGYAYSRSLLASPIVKLTPEGE